MTPPMKNLGLALVRRNAPFHDTQAAIFRGGQLSPKLATDLVACRFSHRHRSEALCLALADPEIVDCRGPTGSFFSVMSGARNAKRARRGQSIFRESDVAHGPTHSPLVLSRAAG